jgi:hypothetical protein
MHGPNGRDYPNESVFDVVEPGRLEIHHLAGVHEFWLSIELEQHGANTRVYWVQRFTSPAELAGCRHIVEPANDQNLAKLAAVVAQLA